MNQDKQDYKSCLMVHNYFGPRRVHLQEYVEDPLFFAKKQIEYLQKYEHSLDKIYFTVNRRGEEDDSFIDELKKILPDKIRQADIEILIRPNVGLSYGAFSDIFKINRLKYDYYFFTEDDYLFVQNDFDRILIGMLNRYDNAGYVSALVREESNVYPIYPKHAGIQMGVAASSVLDELFIKCEGMLPHNNKQITGLDYGADELAGNVGQTNQIYQMGYELYDTREFYTSYVVMPWPYLKYEQWFDEHEKEIITPAHKEIGKMYPTEVKSLV